MMDEFNHLILKSKIYKIPPWLMPEMSQKLVQAKYVHCISALKAECSGHYKDGGLRDHVKGVQKRGLRTPIVMSRNCLFLLFQYKNFSLFLLTIFKCPISLISKVRAWFLHYCSIATFQKKVCS